MPTGHYERKPIKDWTKEEYEIIWNERFNFPKNVMELITDRSLKSVKHVMYSFRKITKEHEEYLMGHRLINTTKEMDKKFSFPAGTCTRYFLMKDLDYVQRKNSYRKDEIDTLKKYAGQKTYQEIADIVGTTEPRIRNLASKLEINTKFIWTKEIQQEVLSYIEDGKSLEEISNIIGKSVNSIKVMLRSKGHINYLEKKDSSIYHTTLPEKYIMDKISSEFNIVFPEKNQENYNYYFGIIYPYEIDIPFEINGHKFAIEYDGEWWHKDRKELDDKKEKIIKEKGYNFFRVSSWMHKYHDLSTLDGVIEIIIQSIKNIIS